jgi:hypothetical protein
VRRLLVRPTLAVRGKSLQEPLKALASWVRSEQQGIEASQRHYDEQIKGQD